MAIDNGEFGTWDTGPVVADLDDNVVAGFGGRHPELTVVVDSVFQRVFDELRDGNRELRVGENRSRCLDVDADIDSRRWVGGPADGAAVGRGICLFVEGGRS